MDGKVLEIWMSWQTLYFYAVLDSQSTIKNSGIRKVCASFATEYR